MSIDILDSRLPVFCREDLDKLIRVRALPQIIDAEDTFGCVMLCACEKCGTLNMRAMYEAGIMAVKCADCGRTIAQVHVASTMTIPPGGTA